MKIALITISLKYVPRGPVSIKPKICSDNDLAPHQQANADLSGIASDHSMALVVHRNLYPNQLVSDPHFQLHRWRVSLGPLMLTVRIKQ